VHATDEVDENRVFEGPVAANVPLKHYPDLLDKFPPTREATEAYKSAHNKDTGLSDGGGGSIEDEYRIMKE